MVQLIAVVSKPLDRKCKSVFHCTTEKLVVRLVRWKQQEKRNTSEERLDLSPKFYFLQNVNVTLLPLTIGTVSVTLYSALIL